MLGDRALRDDVVLLAIGTEVPQGIGSLQRQGDRAAYSRSRGHPSPS
jgi:hypothetical protein